MVSSNTFGVDCISNLSDRSPDSDSERDSEHDDCAVRGVSV